MVRHDGYAKLLDFGLAVLRPQAEVSQSMITGGSLETVAQTLAGTPAYMSPEQIEGGAIDARSDIFSLGILLCEAATGTNPFARSGVLETLSAIGQAPAPAAAATTDLPREVRSIVIRALDRSPSQRYQSSADLASDLRAVLSRLDSQAVRSSVSRSRLRWYGAAAAIAISVASVVGGAAYRRSERRHWVREQATPEIVRLASQEKFVDAFRTIQVAEQYLPDDPDLTRAAAAATRMVSIHSEPSGAVVEVQDYLLPKQSWLHLGVTPIEKHRIPGGYLRWKVSKAGVGEYVTAPIPSEAMKFDLAAAAKAPQGMVPVDGGPWTDSLAFLGWLGPYMLPPFFIDRFEVTNRQYQAFVDKGGYARREYWKQPFVRDGRELKWEDAMDLFRDGTGRPGPSTWEAGHYPEGKGDFPVSGVSWFEAAAYAEFSGKSLPAMAQGYKATPAGLDRFVVAMSNLSGNAVRVGQFDGLGPYGTSDMIGNVREWYWNASEDNSRFILGRQANSYGPEALSPFDRSPLNGFRGVRNTGPVPDAAMAPLTMLKRDFSKAKPVADDVFRVYRDMYAYDRTPLNAMADAVADGSADWTTQKITFNAAYRNEQMSAFLFLPKNTRPPFQTVVFFPSARVNFLKDSTQLGDMTFVDYVIKSGRAVIYPIYERMYERRSSLPVLPGPTLARQLMVDWSKDLARSIDYLQTRADIDRSRIGYLGVSAGSAYGVILTTLEDRLKAVVFLDGGFFQQEHPVAGMDQADFAPRMKKPVLMVNGRYDATFPYESAQLPMFRMLGTPAADKHQVVFDTPHDVRLRRSDLVREVLAWYDRYLGHVN
jgi:hypothetical protein